MQRKAEEKTFLEEVINPENNFNQEGIFEKNNDDFFKQPVSREIWESKYQLKNKDGVALEKSIFDTFRRVAVKLSENEENSKYWEQEFYKLMSRGKFIGAGRIISNAGAEKYKNNTSLINCTVMNQIPDSMEGIMQVVKESARTLQRGSGVGYDFSTIRPKGALVRGVGSGTSGPLSFMEIYDKMCFTIQSAGGRRGAQMGLMDCQHPDIIDYIKAKREDGKLRQFNLSVLITKKFMDAVINDKNWELWFWERKSNLDLDEVDEVLVKTIKKGDIPYNHSDYNYFKFASDHIEVEYGNIEPDEIFVKRVYKVLPAREIWDLIMKSTYDYAEPGFILIDEVNKKNNLWWLETIRATNPCGEQPLPPNGACLLGSMILPTYVKNPFREDSYFDYEEFRKDIKIATRFLDNVVEFNGLPLEAQVREIKEKRRHGMGFTGLGNTFAMLRTPYGSEKSIDITSKISKILAEENYKAGIELAKEKGMAKVLERYYPLTDEYIKRINEKFKKEDIEDFKKAGLLREDEVRGSILHAASNYFDVHDYDLRVSLAKNGCRFTHATTIAPNGTISLVSNNVSNGIEPPFMFSYFRNVIVEGNKTKQQQEVMDYSYLMYKTLIDKNVTPDKLPDYFVSTETLTAKEHIAVQAAAQKYIDTSISKTINVKTDYPFDDFKDIYIDAYKSGLKGVTTFRYNPNFTSGVLVSEKNLKNTVYEFTLEDGSKVKLKGNEKVIYEGQEHVVSNLYDALKEGYYGKF